MPRGNINNLDPIRSNEEARRRGSSGGKKSGVARRNKALLKDCINILMEQKYIDEETGKKVTGAEQLTINLWKKALAGDTKAWELLRDTAGQKPTEKIEQVNTNITIDFGDVEDAD